MKWPTDRLIAFSFYLLLSSVVTSAIKREQIMSGVYTPSNAYLGRSSVAPTRELDPALMRYLIIFKPGPKWIPGKSIFEQPLKTHAEYMQKLYTERKLLYAGPFLDDQGGVAILSVSNADEVRQILANEPATREQIFVAEAHPWYLTFDTTQNRSLFQEKPKTGVR